MSDGLVIASASSLSINEKLSARGLDDAKSRSVVFCGPRPSAGWRPIDREIHIDRRAVSLAVSMRQYLGVIAACSAAIGSAESTQGRQSYAGEGNEFVAD